MYVNSISQPQIKNLKNNETNILKKEPNFKAKLTPEMEKNCYKIVASTDLWGKPTVRIPQSKIEKEAVLEVLYHRLRLEKLSRLYNQLFVTHAKIDRENELLEKAPKSPELAQLSRELDAMGNLKTYFMTLKRKIEDQEKRNKTSLKYFDDIDAMEAQYREQKILNDNKFQKLYADFKKGKIEADSIEELINIIESNEVKKDNIFNKIFSNIQPKKSKRNQLLDDMTDAYRYHLRQFIDPYDSILDRSEQAKKAMTLVLQKYRPIINTYYNEGANTITKKDLSVIFDKVQHEFTEHSYNIFKNDVEVFPLDEAWPIVNENKEIIKKTMAELQDLELNNPENIAKIEELKKEIEKGKQHIIQDVKDCLEKEQFNRNNMESAGVLRSYEYLMKDNPNVKAYNKLIKAHESDDPNVIERAWEEFLA